MFEDERGLFVVEELGGEAEGAAALGLYGTARRDTLAGLDGYHLYHLILPIGVICVDSEAGNRVLALGRIQFS